jgi:hypothetical protein
MMDFENRSGAYIRMFRKSGFPVFRQGHAATKNYVSTGSAEARHLQAGLT